MTVRMGYAGWRSSAARTSLGTICPKARACQGRGIRPGVRVPAGTAFGKNGALKNTGKNQSMKSANKVKFCIVTNTQECCTAQRTVQRSVWIFAVLLDFTNQQNGESECCEQVSQAKIWFEIEFDQKQCFAANGIYHGIDLLAAEPTKQGEDYSMSNHENYRMRSSLHCQGWHDHERGSGGFG